jgi:hypothetical protein
MLLASSPVIGFWGDNHMKTTMMRVALTAAALGFAVPAAAQVRYFDFTIDGFTDGATLTGWFAGEDLNDDGALVAIGAGGEITQFSAHFSGNSIVGAVDFDLAELQNGGLLYAFGNPHFTGTGTPYSQEGVAAGTLGGQVMAGGKASGRACNGVGDCFLVTTDGLGPLTDYSLSLGSVTEITGPPSVPEPASWALMLGGFGLIGTTLRRRSLHVRFV